MQAYIRNTLKYLHLHLTQGMILLYNLHIRKMVLREVIQFVPHYHPNSKKLQQEILQIIGLIIADNALFFEHFQDLLMTLSKRWFRHSNCQMLIVTIFFCHSTCAYCNKN